VIRLGSRTVEVRVRKFSLQENPDRWGQRGKRKSGMEEGTTKDGKQKLATPGPKIGQKRVRAMVRTGEAITRGRKGGSEKKKEKNHGCKKEDKEKKPTKGEKKKRTESLRGP